MSINTIEFSQSDTSNNGAATVVSQPGKFIVGIDTTILGCGSSKNRGLPVQRIKGLNLIQGVFAALFLFVSYGFKTAGARRSDASDCRERLIHRIRNCFLR